jgi:hypothetical protein
MFVCNIFSPQKKRKDLCQKYISEKRCEYQLNKLSPKLPSAFEIRKDVTRQYYDKAPPYYNNSYARVQKTAVEKAHLHKVPVDYPQMECYDNKTIDINDQYNQHKYQ